MRKRPVPQREVIIPFCEGDAEINLFGFLKLQYPNKKIEFRTPINFGGFNDFAVFEKKYKKKVKEQDLKPKRNFLGVKFLFIFDNDLGDSEKIKQFLEKKGHLVQLCDPNTEGMILAIVKKPQTKIVGDKEYRKKCKDNFKSHFDCEAHHLKDKKLKEVFDREEVFRGSLPVLYKLFRE